MARMTPRTAVDLGLMQGAPPPAERLVTPDNWIEGPYNRWGFLHVRELARTARISRGDGPVRALASDPLDLRSVPVTFEGETVAFADALAHGYTDAVCVVHDGRVVFEHYVDGMRPDDTHLLMSVSKSLTATLVGALVGDGVLDPEGQVVQYVSALRGTAWEGCTVQHLLDMRAGTRFDEDDYLDPDSDGVLLEEVCGYRPRRRTDLPAANTYDWIVKLENARPHGRAVRVPLDPHRRAGMVRGGGHRHALPRALLAARLEPDRRRARRRHHRRRGRLRDRRGRDLHDRPRPRALRAHAPRGRRRLRPAGRPGRMDRAAARARRGADRRLRQRAARAPAAALLPRQVVGLGRGGGRLQRLWHQRPAAAHPSADAHRHRAVLDVARSLGRPAVAIRRCREPRGARAHRGRRMTWARRIRAGSPVDRIALRDGGNRLMRLGHARGRRRPLRLRAPLRPRAVPGPRACRRRRAARHERLPLRPRPRAG